MSQRLPLRVSRDQWIDIKEWYEEPDDWTEAEPEEIDFPDDHDRRYDDFLSTREGDIGDHELPPF